MNVQEREERGKDTELQSELKVQVGKGQGSRKCQGELDH